MSTQLCAALLQYFPKLLRFPYMQRVTYALGWVLGAVLILVTALPGRSAHVEPFEAPGEARARGEIDALAGRRGQAALHAADVLAARSMHSPVAEARPPCTPRTSSR